MPGWSRRPSWLSRVAEEFRIVERPRRKGALVYIALSFFWLTMLLGMVGFGALIDGDTGSVLPLVVAGIFAFLGFYVFYYGLTGLVNRSVLTINTNELRVRVGPLPWPGRLSIDRSQIYGLTISKSTRKDSSGNKHHTYTINALLKTQRVQPLISGYAEAQTAENVRRKIAQQLRLDYADSFVREPAIPDAIAMPPGLEVGEAAQTLTIAYRPSRGSAIAIGLFAVAWTSGIAMFTVEAPWFFLPFVFPFWIIAAGLLYYCLIRLVNHTWLQVGGGLIRGGSKPLPWFGTVSLDADSVEQLLVRRRKQKSKGGTHYSFDVMVHARGGQEIKLAGGFEEYDHAIFVERRIELYLGIENRMVKGEFKQ